MQVNIKDRQEVEATVEVTLPAAEVDGAFASVLRELSGRVRIPGFRPGKVPAAILEKRIGAEALAQEVREMLIDGNYREAVAETDLKPIGLHFHGGNPSRGEDFSFDIHMDLAPEINLPDIDQIVIDTPGASISDEDIDAAVKRLQQDNATMVPVDRAVQAGDVLTVETVSEDGTPGSTMPVDMDAVSEQLAEQLVGKSAGDEVELVLASNTPEPAEADTDADSAVDEDVVSEVQAPEPTRLKVRISDVREKELPEADDEFASTLGFANWEEARAYIHKTLLEQAEADAFEAQKNEFVDKLLADSPFPVPAGMLNRRQEYLLSNLQEDLGRRGITMQDYLARLDERGETEKFQQDLINSATEAVRRDLALEKLMIDRQTVFTDEEFEEALAEAAAEEGKDVAAIRRERGEEWERNYRFLLQREKALEDAVKERLAAAAVAALG